MLWFLQLLPCPATHTHTHTHIEERLVTAQPKLFYYSQLGIIALNKLKHFLSHLQWTPLPSLGSSPFATSTVLAPSPAAASLSSSTSVLPWPQPTAGGHALFNPNNTPLLQPSSHVVCAASSTAIVSLSHTHQVIPFKLTNTNYL